MNEITTEAFNVMLRCVSRAPDSALKYLDTCAQCRQSIEAEWAGFCGAREDFRHRLMVKLLTLEEDHVYLLHGKPLLPLSDDDSEAEADAAAERASWMLPPHFPGD